MHGGGGFGIQQGILGTMNPEGAFHVVRNSLDMAPAGITTGPDGNLWYADSRGKIVRITPAGFITEYPVPVPIAPSGIAAGADGVFWFTEGFAPSIGRISLNGAITEFPLLSSDRRAGTGALGPDGNMWFPESSQDGLSYWIARITPGGVITEFPIPTESAGAGAITAGPDGNMWFTESGYGTNTTSKIGRIDLAGSITEFPIPTPNAAPSRNHDRPGREHLVHGIRSVEDRATRSRPAPRVRADDDGPVSCVWTFPRGSSVAQADGSGLFGWTRGSNHSRYRILLVFRSEQHRSRCEGSQRLPARRQVLVFRERTDEHRGRAHGHGHSDERSQNVPEFSGHPLRTNTGHGSVFDVSVIRP